LRVSFRIELGADAQVFFSTRAGGVSEGPYRALNLGLLTGDDRDNVLDNRRRFADQAGVEAERVAMGWQVHGTDVHDWSGPDEDQAFLDPQGGHLKVDGHFTREPTLGLLVLVADCLPVALAGGGAVAMVHCGWRGLAGGLIGEAAKRFGPEGPQAAAVGPGIGACCYEVGDEVLESFAQYEGVARGRMLDLRAIADAQLRAAGVDHVEHVDMCTSCREDLFFSHRRDKGVTGRQGGIAWLSA
jgi:purine-nucleoside/S-methyl-5'-thioadenosine phosphorylase / adenosine deaminase